MTEPSADEGATARPKFVSEPITPVAGAFETSGMLVGEPGAPQRFRWRDTEYEVTRVLKQWRETSPCRHGSGEMYVRKHWYEVATTDGHRMKLYFERQARAKSQVKARWWLHTIDIESAEDG
jgi:phosphoribosylglycinamide formyltransferase-1